MTTRELLMIEVSSMNKHLWPTVNKMSVVSLLRNCHPSFRRKFATEFRKEDLLSEEESHEFTDRKRNEWT